MSFLKITEIKKLGIFDNYTWKCSEDFKKYNILFGFNGSGKSTLSNLFNLVARKENYSIEKKAELFADFKHSDNATLKLTHTSGENLSYPPIANQNNKNIFVFNANFITDHVFDGQVGRIRKFNVTETVLEDTEIKSINKKIGDKTKQKDEDEIAQKIIFDKFTELKQIYSLRFRDSFPGKSLRIPIFPSVTDLPTITKVELIKSISQKIDDYKLSEKQTELETDIKLLEDLSLEYISIDFDVLETIFNTTAKQQATNKLKAKIDKFQNEIDEYQTNKIEPWYKLGQQLLEIDRKESPNKCPLCDSDITMRFDHLIDDFSDYFDKSYEEFSEKIKVQKKLVEIAESVLIPNNEAKSKLSELSTKYESFIVQKFPIQNSVNILPDLKSIIQLILEKQGNSSKGSDFDFTNIIDNVKKYNFDIENLNSFNANTVLALKSRKIDPASVETEIRTLYSKLIFLDLNGESTANNIKKYHKLAAEILANRNTINDLTNQKVIRLRNLKMEAKKVGEYLAKLGIYHFTIDLNEANDTENILIKYKDDERIKTHLRNTLSEGEKTALAFAYFLSKVSIEVNDKSKTIVVIDDPISSLDDNRLYHTAYLINEEFKDYNQIFVLSHNLLFLKYLNPLFNSTKSKSCYIINNGSIEDLPKSLQNFQSPYFYMLGSLMIFNANVTPDYEEARKYLPNYIRRILETFFSFRYAQLTQVRNKNQSPGLDDFISNIIKFDALPELTIGTTTKQNIKDRLSNINKICDNFSHGNTQQLDECNFLPDESLKQIATETLEILGYFDGLHFQKVEELVQIAEIITTTEVS